MQRGWPLCRFFAFGCGTADTRSSLVCLIASTLLWVHLWNTRRKGCIQETAARKKVCEAMQGRPNQSDCTFIFRVCNAVFVCRSCNPAAHRRALMTLPYSAPPPHDAIARQSNIETFISKNVRDSNPKPYTAVGSASSPRRRSARRRSERTVVAGPQHHRHRGRATPLPPAFPPPARGMATIGGDGDGASTSSTSSRSPELDRSVAVEAPAGLDAPAHELELSVPSHQEHLTADGQR